MTENKSVDKRWENPQPLGINSLANSSSLRSDLYPARLFIPAGFGFSRSVINRIDILHFVISRHFFDVWRRFFYVMQLLNVRGYY